GCLLLTHYSREALEQIERVLRTRARLRVMLHRYDRLSGDRQAAVRTVKEGTMTFLDPGRQRCNVHGEAVIHRHDLDLAGSEVLHRMVRAVMALGHFPGLRPQRQRQNLVAEADAEHRHAGGDQLPDLGACVFSSSRRIAWAV